jgi:hypothetical protein
MEITVSAKKKKERKLVWENVKMGLSKCDSSLEALNQWPAEEIATNNRPQIFCFM